MLVLSRKKNESILIDGRIRVTVVDLGNNVVKIGIEAPGDVNILRSELVKTELNTELAAAYPAPQRDNVLDCAV